MGIFLFLVLAIGLGIWVLGSRFILRDVESARYFVESASEEYEIRKYPASVIAEVKVFGSLDVAANEGFSILSGYILGANEAKVKLPMMTPVEESLAGPAAVSALGADANRSGGVHTVAFLMPRTGIPLPKPIDHRIILTEMPTRFVAAYRFGWYPTDARVAEAEAKLLGLLERDGRKPVGEVELARYDAPFSMPLLLRNEILIEVE
jgi:hypothetical protein